MSQIWSYIDAIGFTTESSDDRRQAICDAEDTLAYANLSEAEEAKAQEEINNFKS